MARRRGSAYQDALPHAVDPPDGGRLEQAAGQQQSPADGVLVLVMAAGGLELGVGHAILGLGDANDHHDLVVRPDDIPVDALGFRVDGAAALIVELVQGAGIFDALARDHIVIWRSALQIVSGWAACRARGSSWPYESLRRQRPQSAHRAGQDEVTGRE